MKTVGGFSRALIGLGFVAAIGCMQVGPSFAGVQESVFFISPDGSNVSFDVRDVSRREVLSRLLRNRSIELEWVDLTFADERITGAFKGTTDAVLQRLLAQTDFVVIYARDGDKSRIARLIILGKGSSSPSKSIELPKMETAAMVPASGEAPLLKPVEGAVALTPPTAADQALRPITPAPPGTVAPTLIPLSSADIAPPLSPPPGR